MISTTVAQSMSRCALVRSDLCGDRSDGGPRSSYTRERAQGRVPSWFCMRELARVHIAAIFFLHPTAYAHADFARTRARCVCRQEMCTALQEARREVSEQQVRGRHAFPP